MAQQQTSLTNEDGAPKVKPGTVASLWLTDWTGPGPQEVFHFRCFYAVRGQVSTE